MTGGTPNYFRLVLPARPENVGLCRLAAAAFASALPFTVAEIEEIKVAVSEAVTNAVVHAYAGRAPGEVRLTGRAGGGLLELWVEDDGCGIADVAKAREPSYSTDPERMGLGFSFMESFMDRLDVDSRPGAGTRVYMARRAGAPRETT